MRVEPYKPTAEHDLEGAIDGVPAFRCQTTATGGLAFLCTCGKTHTHGAGEGHRVGHCDSHRPGGYYLLGPVEDLEQMG